jgi:hypothetical protein
VSAGTPSRGTERTKPPRARGRWGITLAQLWAFLAVALPVTASLGGANLVRDFGYQIRAGEIMLRSLEVLRTEVFSFTSQGDPWLNQQWGADVLFALLHRAGGWTAFALTRAVLVGVIFGFVYLACRAEGAGRRLAAGLTLASFAIAVQFIGLRPQLPAAALFALTLWLVAGRRAHPGRLWAVPVAVVFWASLHGTFFFGPLLVGLAWLEDRRDRWPQSQTTLLVGAVSLAATLLNPFGIDVWRYAIDLSTNPLVTRFVAEWVPPSIREVDGAVFYLSLAAVLAIVATRPRRVSWISLLGLGIFAVGAMQASRGILWWAMAAPVLLVPVLVQRAGGEEHPEVETEPRSVVNTAIAVIVIAVAVSFLPWWRGSNPIATVPNSLTSDAPVQLTVALQRIAQPGQRLFNAETWGSWFEFQLPENPTFVDSRIEVFPASVWRDYVQVSFGQEGWQDILDRWDVQIVAAEVGEQRDLIPRIQADPGWRQVYEDEQGYVFIRA